MGPPVVAADAPAILAPSGRELQRVPWELVRTVDQCDDLLRRHGMQMMLVCEKCHAAGHPHPFVKGDNQRGASTWKMTCACTERRYDFSVR